MLDRVICVQEESYQNRHWNRQKHISGYESTMSDRLSIE